MDDVRLLPEDVGVEGPHVTEAEAVRPLGQIDDSRRRGRGLEYDTDVHGTLLVWKRSWIERVR